ncbi:recombinase RecT [Streptococcus danieliae]|uniref:recombinase RecT n=1 Tax=Streptococcus danieliae TaxID=747656 RepID=UPI0021C61A59|nr:RecT family recombinase [Streptococcus danieliae]MCU0082228.1 recombinase RecT [Streptococcus danieliae]
MANELTQKQITSSVANRIQEMQGDGLKVAPNYSVTNALSSAYYALENSPSGNLLEKCTQISIYNALLDMVTQGLSPAKTQCYFIPYGNTVKLTRSYFGTMKVVKQLPEVKDIYAEIIYEGDDFKIKNENGRKVFVSHETDWQNADNPIVGAYCIIEKHTGEEILTVMTKKEIDDSWSQSRNKSVQNKFPQEMAKRTVINRAAKHFFNTSNDNDLFVDAVNRTTQNEYEEDRQIKEAKPVQSESESLDDILGEPQEIAPEDSQNLDNLLEAPEQPQEDEKEEVEQIIEEESSAPETKEEPPKKTRKKKSEVIDQETGEIFEQESLFEGMTTNPKEV